MADLDDIAAFAVARGHNLTGPLTHEQVVALATAWIPEIRFHERERFHPVDLSDLLTAPPQVFARLPEPARDAFRIPVRTGTLPGGEAVVERFDPPVVHTSAGSVRLVLGSGTGADDGMLDIERLGHSGVYSHGARIEAAREFFGASVTVSGAGEPAPLDPRLPRYLPIVVRAEMRMLLETLKHELELDGREGEVAERDLPIDAVWSGFAVQDSFFEEDDPRERKPPFLASQKRAILAALVQAHEAGDEEAERAALAAIPDGWSFVTKAWDVVRDFAFLEFYLVYAFNDYKEYGDAPFENEHEGDVEGCCVIFERRDLEDFANGGGSAEAVVPHSLITAAHEEFQGIDSLKKLPLGRDRARAALLAYVAPGSHASYLTAGSHDILDFEDVVTDLPLQLPTWMVVVGALTGLLQIGAIVAGIVEHFVDAEDQTSDNGVSVGPGDPDPGSLKFEKRLEVTPLSSVGDSVNIYQEPLREALAVRGYVGKWGGDDALRDKSPLWENKTARYFRRFLLSDNIATGPVVD